MHSAKPQYQPDRAMVGASDFRHDKRFLHIIQQVFRDEEIVDSPTDISGPGSGFHVPPAILSRLFVKMPESVDVAVRGNFIQPSPFLG